MSTTGEGTRQRRQGAKAPKPKPPAMFPALIEPGQSALFSPTSNATCPLSPAFKGLFTPCNRDGDEAAGPEKREKRISLSEPGFLPRLCRCIPGLILFPLMIFLVATVVYSRERVFYCIAGAFSMWTLLWTIQLSTGCVFGLWRMRHDVTVNWDAKLKKLQEDSPETSDFMHIVFLPNYKEDESMLDRTLKSLGSSAIDGQRMHIVLACEDRESEIKEKAARLVESNRHLFADIFATFHPGGLPGDVAGKSSNCQWAYKHALEKLAFKLGKFDFSKVFITCCDADTLFHPQYFSALAYQALTMPRQDRAWSIWQPPILLFRNLYSSPGPTRLSGYATLLFELSGLAYSKYVPHFSYSSYSLTLELSLHRYVRGWDRDVIAEDHHMFVKCFYASVWDQVSQKNAEAETKIVPRLKLQPLFLPAISFLVQSDGWFASIYARFLQARRHSQGLAELSYSVLQYMHVILAGHAKSLSISTHASMLAIPAKMANVHIISSMHTFCMVLIALTLVSDLLMWISSHGLQELIQVFTSRSIETILSLQSFEGAKWWLCAIFGPIPPMAIMLSLTTLFVVLDTMEGKMTSDPAISDRLGSTELAAPDVEGSARGPNGLRWWEKLRLTIMLECDHFSGALITMFAYGMLPASMAAWFLLFQTDSGFTYVVGEKPTAASTVSMTVCACDECLKLAALDQPAACCKARVQLKTAPLQAANHPNKSSEIFAR